MFRTKSEKHQILLDYMCKNIIYTAAVHGQFSFFIFDFLNLIMKALVPTGGS